MVTLLDLCVSSLRRGHANLLCIVPILTDDPRRESNDWVSPGSERLRPAAVARGATSTKTLAFTCTHFRYLCPSALYINQRLALPQQPNLYLEPKWLRYPSILCITRPAAEQRIPVTKGHPLVEILEWSLFAKGLTLKGLTLKGLTLKGLTLKGCEFELFNNQPRAALNDAGPSDFCSGWLWPRPKQSTARASTPCRPKRIRKHGFRSTLQFSSEAARARHTTKE
mgnify:CR=1 FL=1